MTDNFKEENTEVEQKEEDLVVMAEEHSTKSIFEVKSDIRRLGQFISKVETRIEKYHRQIEKESNLGDETLGLVKQGLSVLEGKVKRIFEA
jgi:hypothetical protein